MAEHLFDGRYLSLVSDDGWEYATRPRISGIVGIVAVTDEGALLLVEQYRPPVKATVVEIPAGLVGDLADDPDESFETAATRELLEETGYRAGRMQRLITGVPSAGMSDERITLLRATQLTREHAGGGDENENITVRRVPLPDVAEYLRKRQSEGCEIDFKVYTALFFAGVHG